MDDYNNRIDPDPEHEKVKAKGFFHRKRWTFIFAGASIVAIAALILALMSRSAASTNPTSPSSSSPRSSSSSAAPGGASTAAAPTQAPPASRRILCQYDATHSFSNWNNSPEWKRLSNGTLGSAGTDNGEGSNNFMAWSGCHTLSTSNYAVEAQIQYVGSADPDSVSKNGMFEFGIILRGNGGTSGYEVGVGKDRCNDSPIAMISLIQKAQVGSVAPCYSGAPVPLSGSGSSQHYNVDTNFHTYRAAITNNTITLSIDGHQLLQTSNNTFANAGQVGLRNIFGDINVKSFTVTAL